MSAEGQAAIVAGVLYLVGIAAGALSVAPSVDSDDFLARTARSRTRVRVAACFQLLMGAAYVGVAIVLYPLLSDYGEELAVGFLGFRLIAGVLVFAATVVLLVLLALSENYLEAAPEAEGRYQTIGDLLRRCRDLVNHVAMIVALALGAVLFYSLLLRAGVGPRWLSIWGLVGAVSAITASLLVLFGVREVRARAYVLLTLPLAAQEVVLAFWLIGEGLNLAKVQA